MTFRFDMMRHRIIALGVLVAMSGCGNPPEYAPVDLKAMSGFEIDQVNGTTSDIPEKWRRLDGKKVELTGEMWDPHGEGTAVERFQLTYSIPTGSWPGPPKAQQFVDCTVLPSRKAGYYENLVNVYGVLHVGVHKGSDRIESVYRLDVERVENANPKSH
jgi:hypothetical protein